MKEAFKANIPKALDEASYEFNLSGRRVKAVLLSQISQIDISSMAKGRVKLEITPNQLRKAYGLGNNSSRALDEGLLSLLSNMVVFKSGEFTPIVASYKRYKGGATVYISQSFLDACYE